MIKIITSNSAFMVLISLFVIVVGVVSIVRGGNDIKVDIFGAKEVQAGRSPYFNPTHPERTIYRYAPPFALMMYPFLAVNKIFGITLSRADLNISFNYNNITVALVTFYIVKVLMLAGIAYLLLTAMPARCRGKGMNNFKIAFMLASPFIAYELVNNQNKIMALFFLILALALFERSRPWLSGIFFNLAIAIYIPLAAFIIYFLKYKRSYILIFFVTALIVFMVIPSLIVGFDYNNYLMKEWYERCLKPFFLSNSYSGYVVELRKNSQSLPSAVGRMFCERIPGSINYRISPASIGAIVKILSMLLVLLSILAVWLSSKREKGLQISVLLILSLLLPSYCLVYTWAYFLIIYFFMFDYISNSGAGDIIRKVFLGSGAGIFLAALLMTVEKTFYMSLLCWVTVALWACLVYAMFKSRTEAL